MGIVETFESALNDVAGKPAFVGVEVVTTSARRRGRAVDFVVVVDRPGGVDLSTCERISADLNAALEAAADPYTLEVRSAGLDRPLVHPVDYVRFAGSQAVVVTREAVAGAKTHRGRLAGMESGEILLDTASGQLRLPLDSVKTARLDYDIRADLQREKRARTT